MLLDKLKEPCADFKEAIEKGILEKEPLMTINEVPFHIFPKGLQPITAERFLQYHQTVKFWESIGMSQEISSDYISEVIEKIEDVRKSANDPRLVTNKCDEALVTLRIYEEHKRNFNIAGIMLEIAAIALVTPNESPYRVDFENNVEKIKLMQAAMEAPNGHEFTVFFWKLCSLDSLNSVSRLMGFIPYWAKEESQMTEREKSQYDSDKKLLILDILKSKKELEGLRLGESSLKPVRLYRNMLNLVKLNSNKRVFSTISTIQNS